MLQDKLNNLFPSVSGFSWIKRFLKDLYKILIDNCIVLFV